jgi:glycosyltransferase involved in cell wall biosynthesis
VSSLPRTLFIARGKGAPAWYRCGLPALALGCDWVGLGGTPAEPALMTGRVPGDFTLESAADYDVIVLQQASGAAWLHQVRAWQAAGARVLYEVDDWLRGVRRVEAHALREHLDRKAVAERELVMRVCDGMIVSTDWLAERYRAFNPAVHVCRNGIDLRRYALTRPAREHVGIGWAGGTGHLSALRPWLAPVAEVMRTRPATRFTTVGQPFADQLVGEFGPERARSIPVTALEVYPSVMTHFDVALAPAGDGGFFRGKSDLRWLEASALGVPVVGDPAVYPEIEHGVTGFHAASPAEARDALAALVDDPALRARVGAAAQAHVRERRRIEVAAEAWAGVLRAVAAGEAVAA